PHLSEPAERELDPDREEEQDHAYFGEALDPMHVGDQAERVGPEHHARNDEPRKGRQTQAVEDEDDDQRSPEDHRQVAQHKQLFHGPLRYRNRIPGQYGNSFCDKVFRRCDGAHTWRVVRPAALAAWGRDRWAALSWAFLSSPALEAAPGRESQRHQDRPTRRRRPPRRA